MGRIAKRQYTPRFNQVICAICCALFFSQAYAAANVCSTASTVNPNIDGGMGGTGVPAKGGLGGTGITAEGGLGGTGVTNDGGLGGTGMTAEGGLGGTGVTADGGMGGTGIFVENGLLPEKGRGGIAIVGVVTGFASICVNDTEVHYDANTPVFDNGNASKLSNLTAGQMVMLIVDKANDRLVARSIGMIDAVVGPIDKMDFKLNQVEVMGQIIQVDEATMKQLRTLEQGAEVRVSGHRLANGRIVATRVGVANKKGMASTYGIVTSVTSDGFVVNGTQVKFNNNVNNDLLGKIKVGNEIQVGGAWNGGAIKPNRIVPQPVKNLMNRVDTAIVEGFVGLDGVSGVSLAGADIFIPQVKASYRSIANFTGKVVKMEVYRDKTGKWVCDTVEERQGALFDKYKQPRNDHSNSGRGSSSSGRGKSGKHDSGVEDSVDDDSNSGSGSSNSGSGSSNSGSGSSGFGFPDDSDSGSGSSGRRSGSGISGSGTSGSNSGSGSSGSSSSGSSNSGSSNPPSTIVVPKPPSNSGSNSGKKGAKCDSSGSGGDCK
jgi:Domain of unknown function (DUF5666)